MKKGYKSYRDSYFKKHGNYHGARSESGFKKHHNKNRHKKQTVFGVADFETTYHQEFNTREILEENKRPFGEETFLPSQKSQVFLVGLKFNIDSEIYISYENLETFFTNISKWCIKNRLRKVRIFFHNLKYDGSYILNYLLKHGWKQTLEKNHWNKPIIGYKQFTALITGGKWFMLCLKWSGIKIEFADSLKLQPASLEDLGKKFGLIKTKDTIDYKQFRIMPHDQYPKEWIEYLKRDVLITEKVLFDFLEREGLNRLTIGSCAYAKIKRSVEELNNLFTIKDFHYFNRYYRGGWCFPNSKLQGQWIRKKNKIRMIDAVSMYPSQMVKYLPYGDPLIRKPKGNSIEFYEIDIYAFKIKKKFEGFNCFPAPIIWVENKAMKPVQYKNFTYLNEMNDGIAYRYYFNEADWKALKMVYDITYEIVKTTYFKAKPYLRKTVNDLFINKQQATNEIDRHYHKLIINNLYGKLGQNPIRPFDYYGDNYTIDKEKYTILNEKNKKYTIANSPAFVLEEKKENNAIAKPVFIASYITALAHLALVQKMIYIIKNGGTFLYCDTDSISFIENKPIKFNDIGNELGCWEYEKFHTGIFENNKEITTNKADGFVCLAPKHYRIVKDNQKVLCKFACAGVDKKKMFMVPNEKYNYNLSITKLSNVNAEFGYRLADTDYSFEKYKGIITMNKIPKEFIWKNIHK